MDIKEARKKLNLTQQELADALGINKATVFRYEAGTLKIPPKRAAMIDYLISLNQDQTILVETHKTEEQKSYVLKAKIKSLIRRLIIAGANGHCELCGIKAPFTGNDGIPYLMITHLESGTTPLDDDVKKMVALCPVCNAKISNINDSEDFKKLKLIASRHNF